MDQSSSPHFVTSASVPASLWIGDAELATLAVVSFIQKQLCSHTGCGNCFTCRSIHEQKHHALLWLSPEKGYTLELLSELFYRISFSLDPGTTFFCVLDKADALSAACANSLLKSLEEPSPGYHFILIAQRTESILPTIKSRCTLYQLGTSQQTHYHPLAHFFTNQTPFDPLQFLAELESSSISEHETMNVLDSLLAYWISAYTEAIINKQIEAQERADRVISLLKTQLLAPPMSGSSKLWWKNLCLQFLRHK